ncbi:DUF1564 domain-containing protein [Leptospira yasudae]|uniref:DUF1564 domain-containing protein n=1 Tax=Leptospira yasudae TaxID=2202201 RepID=UPI001083C456|nr:DUF1564 domain-containing protein [Leptospira yasudae]TGK23484.1 DUF1564 domain-containing protein [Leptospira yasudae]TGM09201.1 DUF1564 domain-containing protein [Leptospira yasudae]
MGVLLLNSNRELRSKLQERRSEVVTLLIPKPTWMRYPERKRRSLTKRIPILLERYGKYLTTVNRLGKNARKTLYQPSSGKDTMLRMNVRVSTGSWAFLGALAQIHGVSRCYLFNYLLWLDEAGVGDSIVNMMNEGGPTFHRSYSYILHLDLLQNTIVRRLETEPIDLFYMLDYRDWFDFG